MYPDEQYSLNGRTVIVTFPPTGGSDQTPLLNAAGAKIISMPVIATERVSFKTKKELRQYDWLVFTSKNGVSAYFASHSVCPGQKIAALGAATAAEVLRHRLQVSFTGEGEAAVHFANELRNVITAREQILLALGTLAPDTLEKALSGYCLVERVNVYQTLLPEQVDRQVLNRIEEDRYDVLLVSSPSAFRNLFSLLKKSREKLRIVSIGSTTTAAIRKENIEPVAVARVPGYPGLDKAAADYLKTVPAKA